MSAVIHKFAIDGCFAEVFETGQTRFVDEEGETIGELPFPVTATDSTAALNAFIVGRECGYRQGVKTGRREMVNTVHELLGIDALISAIEGGRQ